MKSSVKRSPKAAFILSVLALVLTVSMLVGTTFAWFTDGITNKANKIVAGNLDIVLEYWNGSDWATVTDTTELFDNKALWEPGYTHQVALRVRNAGTLALKYQLSAFVLAEKEGVNAAGESFKLSDYIQFGVVEHEGVYATRDEAVAAVAGASTALASGFFSAAKALDTATDVEDYVTMVVYMPTSVGNEVNSKDATNLPEITLGLSLVATQTANEKDGFGDNKYDDGVNFPAIEAGVLATNVADMKAAIAEGKNVIIAADMAIDEVITIPAGKNVTINVGNANLSIDPSVTIGRPFELADGASLTINNSQSGVVAVGAYGLVNIPANIAADVTVNGGVYTATTDSGAFIKLRNGEANVNVTLNNVTYTDSYVGNFGGMVFNAEDISGVANVTVNGGSFTANAGFMGATALTVKNATINTKGVAIEVAGVATIENCTITAGDQTVGSAPAVAIAASNNGVAVVKNSTLTATTALGVFPTGGAVSATGCEINGATKVWDMYAGKTGVITVDGAIVGQAGAVATAGDAATLGAALAAGGTVVLTDDVVLNDAPITVADDAIIVLNGNTLSGKSTSSTTSNLIKVAQDATLTIADGTVSFYASNPDTEWGGVGQPAFPGYANNTISCAGKLVINGGVIENLTAAGGASYAIDCYPGADLVINGGEINGHGKCAIRMFANSNTEETKVTINGGNIIGSRGIWVQLPGSNVANVRKASLTINGGTITATKEGELAIYSYSFGDSFAGTNITITGGTFNGPVGFGGGAKTSVENVVITGGTFNGGVWRYLEGGSSVEIEVPTV